MRWGTALLLLAFVLFVASNAQEPTPTEDFFDLPPCKPVQNFFLGTKYTYQYEGFVETQQQEIKNGVLLNCSVEITIPYNCAGTLVFNNCEVSEAKLIDGSLAYIKSPNLNRVGKLMRHNPVYFHFGDGKISKVFADPAEPSDVLNIKKAALSALQIYFPVLRRADLNSPVEYEEQSIFGVGNVKAQIRTVEVGAPRRVTVERNTANFRFPWRADEYIHMHASGETSDARSFASNLIASVAESYEEPSMQKCDYMLKRGRVIEEVTCLEEKSNLKAIDYIKMLMLPNADRANTKIRLIMKKIAEAPMASDDRISSTERTQITTVYTRHSVVYEEQWKEVIEGQFVAFDPESVIGDLIVTPSDPFAAAKFAKVATYLPTLSNTKIEALWNKISRTYTGEQLESLTSLWVQLLYSCSSLALRCHLPACREALACQAGLQNFVSSRSMSSWTPEIENGVMKAMELFEKPNADVVAIAHNIATQRTSPLTVLTLGKVLVRYVKTCNLDTLESSALQAITFLQTLINNDCSISNTYNEHEVLMIAVMKSLNALPASAQLNPTLVVNCAYNLNAPKPVAMEAVRTLYKLNLTPAMRAKVLTIFTDNSRPIEVRLTCYVHLINNNPTMDEFQRISDIVGLEETPKAVKYYVKEHIKSQIQYRNTRFCTLSKSFADAVLASLRRNNWVGLDFVKQTKEVNEKEYNFARPIYIPYLRREINFFVKSSIVMPQDSFIPLLANVAISTEAEGKNITLLELALDLNKMLSLLRPLIGSNGLFQEPSLNELLNLPLSQLLDSATNRMPPLTEAELRSLVNIQDKAYVAYDMLKMENSWPIYIKLLNNEIDLNNLLRMPWLRGINLNLLWKLSQEFENGKAFNGLEANEPLNLHSASPTSIGLPHVHHINFAYYYNLQSTLTAQIRNIFLYRRGTVSAIAKPIVRSSIEWSHRIQLPGGATCGAGYLVNVGHSSDVSVAVNVEPYEINVNFAPLPETTEIFSLSTNNMQVVDGVLEVIPRPSECPISCFERNCERGTHLHYKNCFSHPMDIGLYLRSDERYHYQLKIDTGELTSMINSESVEGKGIEVSLGRRTSATATNIDNQWKIGLKYFPTLSQLRCEYTYQNAQPWVAILKSALLRVDPEDDQSAMQYYQAAMKLVRPDGTYAFNNELKITRQASPESALHELMSYFTHHSDEANTYVVDGKFQIPILGYYTAKGLVKSESNNLASYSARIQLLKGTAEQPGRTLGHFSIQTSPVTDGAMTGHLTVAKMEEIDMPMIPFNEVTLRLRTVNDTAGNCRNIVHMEGVRRDGRPTPFVNLRYDLTKTSATLRTAKATLTCNSWQMQVDLATPNTTAIICTTKLMLPTKAIPNTMMDSNVQGEVRIAEDDVEFNPTCVTCDVTTTKNADGETTFRMDLTTAASKSPIMTWAIPEKVYYYSHVTLKPNVCDRCHQLDVKLPYLSVMSKYLTNSTLHEMQTEVEIHRTILSYLYLPKRINNWISQLYTDDKLTFGISEWAKAVVPDHEYAASLTYFFGERRFNVQARLESPLSDMLDDVHVTGRVECSRCVPLLNTEFRTDMGFKYRKLIGAELADFSPSDRGYSLRTKVTHRHTGLAAIAARWSYELIYGDIPKRLRTDFDLRYRNLYRPMFAIMPESTFELPLALNVTLKPNLPSPTIEYDVSMNIVDSLWQGTFTVADVPASRFPHVCTIGSPCNYLNLTASQITNCADFSKYFGGKEVANIYRSAQCGTMGVDLATSGRDARAGLFLNFRRNPRSVVNRLAMTVEQTRRRTMLEWDCELSKPVMFIPVKTEMRVMVEPGQRLEARFDTGTLRVDALYSTNEEATLSISTTDLPVELDCVYRATTEASALTIAVPKCSFRFRPLTGEVVYDATVAASVAELSQWNVNFNVLADKQAWMKIKAAFAERTLSAKLLCGEGAESPCNVTATVTPSTFSVNTRIYSTNVNCALIDGTTSLNVATPTVAFSTSVQIDPNYRVAVNFNSPNYFTNSLLWENGLRSLSLDGSSVRIPGFAAPCSWHCTYLTNPTAPAHWDATVSSAGATYRFKYFKGRNNPVLPFHVPSVSTTSELHLVRFEYRACSSFVHLENVNVYAANWERLLTTTVNTTWNAWPFVKESSWRKVVSAALPVYVCSSCMGPIELYAKYDATEPTAELINITSVLSDAAEMVMNYETRMRSSESMFYLKGATNILIGKRGATNRPVWNIRKLIDLAPANYRVDIDVLSKGYDDNYSFETKNNYRVSSSLSSKMQIRTPAHSFRYLVEVDSTRAIITCSYPDTRDALLLLDLNLELNQNRLTIRDARITTGMHQWQLTGTTASLVKNIDQRCVGFSLENLRLTRTCKCASQTPCPCDFTIVGDARVELGGPSAINIRDTENKMINVRLSVTPGDVVSLESLVHLKLPVMLMDMTFVGQYGQALINDNMTLSMALRHPGSGKMIPVVKSWYRSRITIDEASSTMNGDVRSATYTWNLWAPGKPREDRLDLTFGPNAEIVGHEMSATVKIGEWMTSQQWAFSKECLATYPIGGGLEICDPRRLLLNATVDFPMLKSTANWKYMDHRWYGTTFFDVVAPTSSCCNPIYHFTESFDLEWTSNPNFVSGFFNMTSHLTWPMDLTTDFALTMTPTQDRTGKTTTISVAMQGAPAVTFVHSPTTASGTNHVRVTSGNELILSGDLVASDCLSQVDLICVPTSYHVTDMDVNLPITSILRSIPMLKNVVPDNGMFDLTLEQSEATVTISCAGTACTVTTNLQLNGPSMPQNLIMDSTLTLSMETCHYRMTLNRWNAMTTWSWTPATMAFTCETTMTTPWIKHHSAITCPGMLMLDDLIFTLKTMGDMGEVLPIDIDLEYHRRTSAGTWNLNLRSCAFEVPSVILINVSLFMNNTMSPIRIRWEISTDRYPALNHIVSVTLRNTAPAEQWTCDLMVSNIFLWTKTAWNLAPWSPRLTGLVVGLPDNPSGVDIRYEMEAATGTKIAVMTYNDRDTVYQCTCRPATGAPNMLDVTCLRTEPTPTKVPPRPVTVAEWQMDASFMIGYDAPNADWMKVIRFLLRFNYSRCLDQPWLEETLRTTFHVSDPDLCRRLSTYLCDANKRLVDTWQNRIDPKLVSNMMNRMYKIAKPYYSYVEPYVRPIAEYLSEDYLHFGMKTVENDDVFFVDVTCPTCPKPMATFEIKVTTDDHQRPIVIMTCTTPIMTATMTMTTNFPMRPINFHWTMGEREITMTTESDENDNLMGMTLTARMGPSSAIRCVAERGAPTAMTMPCVCNRLEGETVGPVVARFNIPIMFMDALYAKVNEWSSYSILKNLPAQIKRDLDLTTDAARYLDEYIQYIKQYIVGLLYNYADAESVVLGRLDMKIATVSVIMEIPRSNVQAGWKIEIASTVFPELNQEMALRVLDVESVPMLQLSGANQYYWMYTNWNLKTWEFFNASFSLEGSRECINITAPTSPRELEIRFKDVNGSPYTCILNAETTIRLTCHVEADGNRQQVCNVEWDKHDVYDMKNVMKASVLTAPTIYRAALKPTQFKRDFKRWLQITDNDVNDILCNYISLKCRNLLDYVNERSAHYIVKYNLANMAKYYNKELARILFESLLSPEDVARLFSGTKSFERYVRDALDYTTRAILRNLEEKARQIEQYYQKVRRLTSAVWNAMSASRAMSSYSVEDYVELLHAFTENVHYYHYKYASKPLTDTAPIASLWNYIYSGLDFSDYLWLISFNSQGPIYYNILTPSINQVITSRGDYLELPVPPENSDCSYVYATDPVRNRFSVIAKGRKWILALPGKLIELATSRTAYVTTATAAREQVNLPYVSDDVICRYQGDMAYCECPYLSLWIKFATNNRVIRSIKFYNEVYYAVGAMGATADYSVPTLFLPNGEEADTVSQLLNAYSISSNCPALVMTPAMYPNEETIISAACERELPEGVDISYPLHYKAYKKACSHGGAGEYAVEPCWYRQAFGHYMTSMGANYMHCCPKSVSKKLFIMLSLSVDSNRISALKAAKKIAQKARKSRAAYDSIYLVTYGSPEAASEPTLIDMSSMVDSEIKQTVYNQQLNGPHYTHDSTLHALRYMAERYRSADGAHEAKAMVVIAPEKMSENCGEADVVDLVEDLMGDSTSVFLYSRLTQEQCKRMHVDLVLNTGGVCVTRSSRVMVQFMDDRVKQMAENSERC